MVLMHLNAHAPGGPAPQVDNPCTAPYYRTMLSFNREKTHISKVEFSRVHEKRLINY